MNVSKDAFCFRGSKRVGISTANLIEHCYVTYLAETDSYGIWYNDVWLQIKFSLSRFWPKRTRPIQSFPLTIKITLFVYGYLFVSVSFGSICYFLQHAQ